MEPRRTAGGPPRGFSVSLLTEHLCRRTRVVFDQRLGYARRLIGAGADRPGIHRRDGGDSVEPRDRIRRRGGSGVLPLSPLPLLGDGHCRGGGVGVVLADVPHTRRGGDSAETGENDRRRLSRRRGPLSTIVHTAPFQFSVSVLVLPSALADIPATQALVVLSAALAFNWLPFVPPSGVDITDQPLPGTNRSTSVWLVLLLSREDPAAKTWPATTLTPLNWENVPTAVGVTTLQALPSQCSASGDCVPLESSV